VKEVGDCWLDAGVVPFSTLDWLHDRAYWEQWFPADFVVEMVEQVRLWFYSALFFSVVLTGKAPYRTNGSHAKVLAARARSSTRPARTCSTSASPARRSGPT